MDINRKQILTSFLETIEDISDKEYQRRVWIRGEGPEVDSYDDAVNYYFIECDSILEHYKDFGITESQFQLLKTFRDRFRIFTDENNWPQKFIDSPEWEEITEIAKEVLKAFNDKKVRQ